MKEETEELSRCLSVDITIVDFKDEMMLVEYKSELEAQIAGWVFFYWVNKYIMMMTSYRVLVRFLLQDKYKYLQIFVLGFAVVILVVPDTRNMES